MKIAITSDLHFYNWPAFANNTNVFNSRNLDVAGVLGTIMETCTKKNIEHLFLLGDIFHNKHKLDVDSLLLFKSLLDKFPGHVHIIPGNHDLPYAGHPYSIVDVFNNDRVHIFGTPQAVTITPKDSGGEPISILMLPYISDSSVIDDALEKVRGKVQYVFGHFGIKNAKLINTDYRDSHSVDLANIESDGLKRIILGHYHTPQKVPGKVPTFYVGSPLHHTFNDEGQDKRFLVLDLKTDVMASIPTEYPSFRTCNFKQDSELEAYSFNKKDYYRVFIDASINPLKVADVLRSQEAKYTLAFKNEDKKVIALPSATINDNIMVKKFLIRSDTADKSDVYQIIRDLQNEVN